VAALPCAAAAQPVIGLYIGTGAGVNIMQNESVQYRNGIAAPGRNLQLNGGATALGSIRLGFGNGLRTEFDYRYNGFNGIIGPLGSGMLCGSEQKYGPMVNVFYDFNGLLPMFVPYIVAGVSYQWATDHVISGSISPSSGTAGAFAYQASSLQLFRCPPSRAST
jgi:OmpA-OmpF porin, OOP family